MRLTASPAPTAAARCPVADGAPRLQRITDYPALLAEAWAQAHAPREANAPTVISTFAGCGGSSLGYHMAGFRELLAVEWEQNAADTFRLNFPDVPLYHGDIAKLSVAECLRLAGVAPGELDVFDGSPPCQGFSTSGKREIGDGRNQLFREYCRLLTGLRPRAFVMENVSGMVKGDFKVIFAEILRTLKACGYRVKVRLLNAMFYGVPQSRERMIFVGVRDDLGVEPSHPSGWSDPVALGVALRGLPDDGPPVTGDAVGALAKMPPGTGNGGFRYLGHSFGLMRTSFAKVSPTLTKTAHRLAHPSHGLRRHRLRALADRPPAGGHHLLDAQLLPQDRSVDRRRLRRPPRAQRAAAHARRRLRAPRRLPHRRLRGARRRPAQRLHAPLARRARLCAAIFATACAARRKTPKTSCRKPPTPFTFRFIQIMMQKTVIDMAKVRLGSVVGTDLR